MTEETHRILDAMREVEPYDMDEPTKRLVIEEIERSLRTVEPGTEGMFTDYILESLENYARRARKSIEELYE